MRAAQFAARFEFNIDASTVALCRGMELSDLPPERVWGEVEKLLLLAQSPFQGLKWLSDLRATRQLFPEIAALAGCQQDPEWHPEGDVEVHTYLAVNRARELIDDRLIQRRR